MSAVPVISVSAATGLLDAVAAAGGHPDQLLSTLGLKRSDFAKPDRFIASSSFTRILEEAARATGDDCFGLHLGERFDERDLGTLAYVVLNSPTTAVAMQNIERYLRIHNEAASVSFTVDGRLAHLRYLVSDRAPGLSSRQHNEYSMALVLKTFRTIAGRRWTPRAIQFVHEAPSRTSAHLRVFGCRASFGCALNAFVVDHDFFERRVPAADPKLYRILQRHAERILGEMPSRDDLLVSVRGAIVEAMRDGRPNLRRTAVILSLSARTLQRRLKARGAVFEALVDDTRRRFALDYLEHRKHTLTEIAFLLGYSEASAFNRAFRRWTASTPLQYRRKTALHRMQQAR